MANQVESELQLIQEELILVDQNALLVYPYARSILDKRSEP